jgi:2-C-methyl-D-erythritol 4-phosphate cytidylyltransferase
LIQRVTEKTDINMFGEKKISVIIPSAGIGKRMGTLPGGVGKQFIELKGRPLLSHTVSKFENSKYVDEIILVCSADIVSYVKREIVEANGFGKVRSVVPGGKERQDSVYAGFRVLTRTDMVLVHDGVRPFIRTEKIDELIEVCVTTGAALLAVRSKDTIKMQDSEQYVKATLDRTVLWNAQTPQAFEYHLLKQAFEKANNESYYGTDESMLVERLGTKIKIVESDYDNIKITTPEDLILAECILNKIK